MADDDSPKVKSLKTAKSPERDPNIRVTESDGGSAYATRDDFLRQDQKPPKKFKYKESAYKGRKSSMKMMVDSPK